MPRLKIYDAGGEWQVEVCPDDPCPDEETHRGKHFIRVWAKDVSRADAQRETLLLYRAAQPPARTRVVDRAL